MVASFGGLAVIMQVIQAVFVARILNRNAVTVAFAFVVFARIE
jgi:hypothetical protein